MNKMVQFSEMRDRLDGVQKAWNDLEKQLDEISAEREYLTLEWDRMTKGIPTTDNWEVIRLKLTIMSRARERLSAEWSKVKGLRDNIALEIGITSRRLNQILTHVAIIKPEDQRPQKP